MNSDEIKNFKNIVEGILKTELEGLREIEKVTRKIKDERMERVKFINLLKCNNNNYESNGSVRLTKRIKNGGQLISA